MKLLAANQDLCTGCGICSDICPMAIIELSEEDLPEPGAKAERLCINCGYCVDACPTGALMHRYRKRRMDAQAVARREKLRETIRRGAKS